MSRKIDELKIDDKVFRVKQLKIQEVKDNVEILQVMADDGLTAKNIEAVAKQLCNVCLENCEPEQILDLTFEDAERIWNKFKEINRSFFKLYSGAKNLLKETGLLGAFQKAVSQILEDHFKGAVSSTPLPTTST